MSLEQIQVFREISAEKFITDKYKEKQTAVSFLFCIVYIDLGFIQCLYNISYSRVCRLRFMLFLIQFGGFCDFFISNKNFCYGPL